MTPLTRREVALALAVAGCGAPVAPQFDDALLPVAAPAPQCDVAAPTDDGWTAVALSDVPALLEEGGVAVVERPLVDVWVMHQPGGCFTATWRVCTHGACFVEPADDRQSLTCPCHGSRFGVDGAVLQGPVDRPLRRFEVRKAGDTIYLRRAT